MSHELSSAQQHTSFNPQIFSCPVCGDALSGLPEKAFCPSCDSKFQVQDEIPNFKQGKASFVWGGGDHLVKAMGEDSLKDGLFHLYDQVSAKEGEHIWQRTYGQRRSALNLLIPANKSHRVLDFGCGYGTISMNLAPFCKEVVAYDQIRRHLDWIRGHAKRQGIKNISLVQGGDTTRLPFKDHTFDTIIMNGSFEWAAEFSKGDPKEVQSQLIQEAHRVLKKGGTLYIGIENRLNYKYFKGHPEGHINMKYGALLPRKVTNFYLKRRDKKPFRVYTYSAFGYREILSKARLGNIRFHATLPHYSSQIEGKVLPKLSNDLPSWRRSSVLDTLGTPSDLLSPSFGITAKEGPGQSPLIDEVMNQVFGWFKQEKIQDVRLDGPLYQIRASGKAFTRFVSGSGRFLLTIGATASASSEIRREHEKVRSLSHGKHLPEHLLFGEEGGHTFLLQRYYDHKTGSDLIKEKAGADELLKEVLTFAKGLPRTQEFENLTQAQWDEHVGARVLPSLQEWFTTEEWRRLKPWIEARMDDLFEKVKDQPFFLVEQHSDLTPSNCLFEDGKLSRVLDWEYSTKKGLPLLDAMTAVLTFQRSNPQSLFEGYPDSLLGGRGRELLEAFAKDIGLSPTWIEPQVFIWLLNDLSLSAERYSLRPHWRVKIKKILGSFGAP